MLTAETIIQSLASGLLMGLLYGLIAVGLALIFARRMTRDIKFLESATARLGEGTPGDTRGRLGVAEFEEMRRYLANADDVLREREGQRAELLAREHAARADAEHVAGAHDK